MIKKANKKSGIQASSTLRAPEPAKVKSANKQSSSAKGSVKSSAPQTPSKREVTFAVYEPQAEQVFVSGAFNDWQATPLTKQANRDWKATVALMPGRHEYKFVVDGKWKIDPRACQHAPNEFGTLNSVIEVKV